MKRIMALIAVLILLSTACAESYPAYVWGDDGASFALLLDADGNIVFTVSGYADDFEGGHLILFDDQGQYHLLNAAGDDALGKAYASLSFDSTLGDRARFIAADDRGAIEILNPETLECESKFINRHRAVCLCAD